MNNMIEIRDIYKGFEGNPVLKGINFIIPPGKTTVIMGRSGCGKSVLLKIILRLLIPDSGSIIFEGQDITNLKESKVNEIRKRIGMLFQGSALFDSLTVWENVAFPLVEHSKLSYNEIDSRVKRLLEFVELPEAMRKTPGELSGGMKKRVGLARALISNPDFIFYDEPTTGLDPTTAARIMQLIIRTTENFSATSIVVTHNIISAMAVGDNFAFIDDGKIVFLGNEKELLSAEVPELQKFLDDAVPQSVFKRFSASRKNEK